MSAQKRAPRKPPKKELRLTPAFLEKLRTAAGFPINLDMRHGEHVLSAHGIGGKNVAEDEVTILVHGLARNVSYPLAAARFTPAKWAQFKKMGDMFFKSLKNARGRGTKWKTQKKSKER